MTHLQKLKTPSLLNWVSLKFPQNYLRPSQTLLSHCILPPYTPQTTAFYCIIAENTEKTQTRKEKGIPLKVRIRRSEAQVALLEYLHVTRSLGFTDAEHISKNAPIFLDKLLGKVEDKQEIGQSLSRFFRYHPINEFEPFFESMGLKPLEFNPLLPPETFLGDDDVLLENYHVLCNYGINPSKIGKIYKEAMEVFRYDGGVLRSKLRAYEELGLSRGNVIKIVASCPDFLIGGVNVDFVKVLGVLKSLGIECNWIYGRLSEKNSYDWSDMFVFLSFICEMGYSKEELGGLIKRHPGLLLDGSGRNAVSTIGLLTKLGCTREEISSVFLQLPQIQFGTFVKNLRQKLVVLMEIEMEAEDIGSILREYLLMLGSFSLKKRTSLLSDLNVGRKRLCKIIKENPLQLKNWALGSKVDPLPPDSEDLQKSVMQKTKFLLNLGYIENSDEMKKTLKVCRGRGGELQDRFDCIVRAGIDPKDVSAMIKASPQVLNQSTDMIERKIDFLVNRLGYPVSALVAWPSFLKYTIDRVEVRFTMYEWLKKEKLAAPMLALSTIVACTDQIFIRQVIRNHPKGLEVWDELKKTHCLHD